MGRPGLDKHPKFRLLVRLLGEPRPHVRGYLEFLWEASYECGNPIIGDEATVEAVAEYPGDSGKLCKALLGCGGPGRAGFIEEVPGEPGRYQIHDLFDHSPDYVKKRMARESQRQAKGQSLSEARAAAGRKGARSRWGDDAMPMANGTACHPMDREPMANDAACHAADSKPMADGYTPAPAPAPAPALEDETRRDDQIDSWTQETRERVREYCTRKFSSGHEPAFRTPLRPDDRELLLKVGFLHLAGRLPEAIIDGGLEAIKHHDGPVEKRGAYFTTVIQDACQGRGIHLNRLLAKTRLPDELQSANRQRQPT
jgi:hypothetical protein